MCLERHSTLPNRVRRLLGFVKSTLKWRLTDGKPLDKWVHESGRVILLGDACHPILMRHITDLFFARVVISIINVHPQSCRAQGGGGFVYLGMASSTDRRRFVLAFPKVKTHATALKWRPPFISKFLHILSSTADSSTPPYPPLSECL